ncbi:MAG: FHA domain-containing protein [Ardenticatenia bacterium]|nr:FHA domain-containing protein [Ardenticatenia bacterium]
MNRTPYRDVIPITSDEVFIGRDSSLNSTCLSHPQISRTHCHIKRLDGMFEVRDLGSTNGTFVNGRQVFSEPKRLAHGDQLRLGPIEIYFHIREVLDQMYSKSQEIASHTPKRLLSEIYRQYRHWGPISILERAVAFLEIVEPSPPPDIPIILPVVYTKVTVGRQMTADVIVPHRQVSRLHCTLLLKENTFFVVDEGSTNGNSRNAAR